MPAEEFNTHFQRTLSPFLELRLSVYAMTAKGSFKIIDVIFCVLNIRGVVPDDRFESCCTRFQ